MSLVSEMSPESEPLPSLPKLAELVALTAEAHAAIGGQAVTISYLPFRVGRERRRGRLGKIVEGLERRTAAAPTNDLYLVPAPTDEVEHIAATHFHIDRVGSMFRLVDRRSPYGTMVGSQQIGRDGLGGETKLWEGDTIKVGGPESPYVFRFRILAAE